MVGPDRQLKRDWNDQNKKNDELFEREKCGEGHDG